MSRTKEMEEYKLFCKIDV